MSDDRSFMNDFDSEHDELAFVKADRMNHLSILAFGDEHAQIQFEAVLFDQHLFRRAGALH